MALTFSHLSADSFEAHLKAGRKRPRVREAVSCWQCRVRKTRCDREAPCKQCQARGIPSQCVYSTPKDQQQQHQPHNRAAQPNVNSQPRRVPKKSPSSSSPPPTSPTQAAQPQTYTPPDSPPSHRETPDRSSSTEDPTALRPPRGSAFQVSSSKTRVIGLSHWMAPTNEMIVMRAMLDHSNEFRPSRKAFSELKGMLRQQNALPQEPLFSPTSPAGDELRSLLPDRPACEEWSRRFFESYGRLYTILDPVAFQRDLDAIYAGTENHPVHISMVLVVVAIGMQLVGCERLRGRALARRVENAVHTSRFQKPCIGAVQVLLLLIIQKNIAASDTDKMYDLLALQGLATQLVLSMGLHRDPAFFAEVSPYHAEMRKRLWASFLRLNLGYCIRSGTQFSLRLDESDCPLPSTINLRKLDPGRAHNAASDAQLDRQAEADFLFCIAATKLAKIIGPVHQALYSPHPPPTAELQRNIRSAFGSYLAELPAHLRPDFQPTGYVEELQQALISINMQGMLTILSLGSMMGIPLDASQRGQLLELWDYATSVLDQFQRLCQRNQEASDMTCYSLWTDAARAALTACWILGRLRRLETGRAISLHPQQSVSLFQQELAHFLTFLSGFWQSRYHLGPVAAKMNLVLAVSLNVTKNLYSDDIDAEVFRQKLFEDAAKTAEETISSMKLGLQEMQQPVIPEAVIITPPVPTISFDSGDSAWPVGGTSINTGSLLIPPPQDIPSGASTPMLSPMLSPLMSGASTPLMGHEFITLDFPSSDAFPSIMGDFGYSGPMFQDPGMAPFEEPAPMDTLWV